MSDNNSRSSNSKSSKSAKSPAGPKPGAKGKSAAKKAAKSGAKHLDTKNAPVLAAQNALAPGASQSVDIAALNEEIRQLRSALLSSERRWKDELDKNTELRGYIDHLENKLREIYEQMRLVRSSTSWMLTVPLRLNKSKLKAFLKAKLTQIKKAAK